MTCLALPRSGRTLGVGPRGALLLLSILLLATACGERESDASPGGDGSGGFSGDGDGTGGTGSNGDGLDGGEVDGGEDDGGPVEDPPADCSYDDNGREGCPCTRAEGCRPGLECDDLKTCICPPGRRGCPCAPEATCDDDSECNPDLGICVCPTMELGCPCLEGTCAGGLSCSPADLCLPEGAGGDAGS